MCTQFAQTFTKYNYVEKCDETPLQIFFSNQVVFCASAAVTMSNPSCVYMVTVGRKNYIKKKVKEKKEKPGDQSYAYGCILIKIILSKLNRIQYFFFFFKHVSST